MDSLPTEIVLVVLELLPKTSLCTASTLNRSFHRLSRPLLYKSIHIDRLDAFIQCCRTLICSPDAAACVLELELLLDPVVDVFSAFRRLITNALKNLHSLKSLHIGWDAPLLSILDGCTFPNLTNLSSVLQLYPDPEPMRSFLIRHPLVKYVCISGEHSNLSLHQGNLAEGVDDLPHRANHHPLAPAGAFHLPAGALPNLASFTGSRLFAPIFIPGRPVNNVSLAWKASDGFTGSSMLHIVSALANSSKPVESITCYGTDWPMGLVLSLPYACTSLKELKLVKCKGPQEGEHFSDDYERLNFAFDIVLRHLPSLTTLEMPRIPSISSPMSEDLEKASLDSWRRYECGLESVVFPSGAQWQRPSKMGGEWRRLGP
ncbi:hypothetical protein SISSUDRAFT_1062747 [Sistotremastrum suecicum HHB10207 ss-3]|uniref:F-box domain-containing protein n=1 Tax=Sistotremastrum suecicum HHB10207 ss-3 TaxID=1314776 RepID=A0A166CIH6_9AGAM|nr:hypothetical protein SISSUDRAFT_1062747 [Sistotremastrum suecicum HHB10207 ss-3]